MLAKFTLVGAKGTGKSFTLRALTFLLCQGSMTTQLYHFQKPKWNVQSKTLNALTTRGNKDFIVIIEYMTEQGMKRIGVGTGGDDPLIIRNNWDVFLCHDDDSKIENEKKWDEVDVAISPCHPGGNTRDQEEYEQHAYKNMDFIYWAKLGMLNRQAEREIASVSDELLKKMVEADVFMDSRDHIHKLDEQQKKQCIWIAQQIKNKIDQLFLL